MSTRGAANRDTTDESLQSLTVVMVVANDLSADARVQRIASSVAEEGHDVTVFGIANGRREARFQVGEAAAILLPVDDVLRNARRRRPSNPTDVTLRRKSFFNHQRDVAANIGWLQYDYFNDRAQRNEQTAQLQRTIDAELKTRALRRAAAPKRGRDGRRRLRLTEVSDEKLNLLRRKIRTWNRSRKERRLEVSFRSNERQLQRGLTVEHDRYETYVSHLTRELTVTGPGPKGGWRRNLPELHDYESVFGPAIDELKPDVIHSHDVHLLGVAARAKDRAYIAGREPNLVYDAHEYIRGLATYAPGILVAYVDLEDEYISNADHIVTVSEGLATLLTEDHGLAREPVIVMNAPFTTGTSLRSVRNDIGLKDSEPLVVYSGGLDPTRGVDTLVKALAELDGVHLGLVVKAESEYLAGLIAYASDHGYRDRVHVLRFVEPAEVSAYLSSASVAVHPMISGHLNHEVAMPNKIFEYMHARLPIVVSDCREMARVVQQNRIGEVFVSGDIESLRDALRRILENPGPYRAAYEHDFDLLDRFSWSSQRKILIDLYRQLAARKIDSK